MSSSCVSKQQCVDCHSWTFKLIYKTANWAFKYQPHPEHRCFALPESIVPVVTDNSYIAISPKGILVASQCHFPMRPPPQGPTTTEAPWAQGKRNNSCSFKHESFCNLYAGIFEGIRASWKGFPRSLGDPSTAVGWAAAFPRDSWCFKDADCTAVTHHTLKDSQEHGITKIYMPGLLIKPIKVLCHSSID